MITNIFYPVKKKMKVVGFIFTFSVFQIYQKYIGKCRVGFHFEQLELIETTQKKEAQNK